eukprot:CAMPEP_0174896972 /NCGR_PEP_ID=MMETSP0167-20121228/11131_1 /TAXON_ID=38298 /ORGANISM="Rhodella maculata, Strain CCMP736" /LENGTH=68 /DNA_ID=CAMNT_0016136675 /DNA_START=8 /DNA_END=214 /DNA_ORIENTATION=-
MVWAECIPPFLIITFGVAGIGAIQSGVHRLFHDEPRKVGSDLFERKMQERDMQIKYDVAQAAKAPAKE